MKLSVLMITYNHENFISQALGSVLMQDVSFDYEVVIGEDCSNDSTRNILVEFQLKYPERIRLLLREKNFGMHRNFVETYNACRGQYVALLEGDDYWTDPQKLQKQVDYLDAHSDCAICFHAVKVVDEIDPDKSSEIRPYHQNTIFTLEDLLRENIIPTCSALFRRGLIKEFPDWIFDLRQMDWLLHILNSQYGGIGYLDEYMAVYRVHQGGVWNRETIASRIEYIIKAYNAINTHFNYKYDNIIKNRILKQSVDLVRTYTEKGDISKAKNILKIITTEFTLQNEFRKDIENLKIRLYWPMLQRFRTNMKSILGTTLRMILKTSR